MAGTKEIKRRIKSVKNTKKITKAMELVAASKMKRAVASTLASRLYAEYSWEVLTSIAQNVEELDHPLFSEKEKKDHTKENILLILITSNRGLCGAYNAQVIKKAIRVLKSEFAYTLDQNISSDNQVFKSKLSKAQVSFGPGETGTKTNISDNIAVDLVTIGKKGDTAMRR